MFDIGFPLFGGRKRRKPRVVPRRTTGPRLQPQQQPRPYVAPRVALAPPGVPRDQPGVMALRDAFTPTRPQRSFRRLAGRKPELMRMLQAISENRAHVVLFGDRGRGKTSLVNLVAAAARSSGYMVGRYSCSYDSEFEEIMRGLARDLPTSLLAVPALEDPSLEGCEAGLPRTRLQSRDIVFFPGRLTGGHLLLIIDEFDRVTDGPTRTRLADTIKQVSDRGASLSFLIVGVSDSLEELLGRHPSIQRNVVGVPLPLLSEAEANEILELGSQEAKLGYPQPIREAIIGLARGVPYIVQLLGLHAGEQALRRGADTIGEADLQSAIEQATAEMDPRISVVYEELTQGGLDSGMRDLLFTIAVSHHDRFARFLVQDVAGELRMAGQPVHPARWERLLDTGAVRSCQSAGFGLYTFTEPMLLHYVLLRAALESDSRALMAETSGAFA